MTSTYSYSSAVEIIGYIGGGLVIVMLSMRTMMSLRIAAILSNIFSMAYGFLAGVHPTFIQHAILLPLNSYRLYEMRRLVRKVREASTGDLSMEWLRPFMARTSIKVGEVLFNKGDKAEDLYFVVSGKFRLVEMGVDVLPGAFVGELGMLAPDNRRTQTIQCTEEATILQIGYDRIEQLYFQNPSFGFYFLRLTSARLFQNIERLEGLLAKRDREIAELRSRRRDPEIAELQSQ